MLAARHGDDDDDDGLNSTLESRVCFSEHLFIQIAKCYSYPCLLFIFAIALTFIGQPRIITKGITV